VAGTDPTPLGLIAGSGGLPLAVARAARRRGRRVVAVALNGQADPALAADVAELHWLYAGQVGKVVETLRAAGAREAVLAGKLPKLSLDDPSAWRPDALALGLLRRLADRHDASILSGVAEHLAEQGIELLPQAAWVEGLLAREGAYGRVRASEAQLADLAFGWPLAKAVASLGIGQTLVVRARAVIAVEAIEGTDATILRAGALGAGASVLKVAKPTQDPRFDLPVVGPDTLRALIEARAGLLAFEAGAALVLEPGRIAELADAHGIALLGVAQPPARSPA